MKDKHNLLTMNLTISEILQDFKDEYNLTIDQVSAILDWTTRTYSNYKNGSSDGKNVKQLQYVKRKIEAVKDYLNENPKSSIETYIELIKSPTKTENTSSNSTMKTIESQQSTIHMLVSQQQKLIDQHQKLIDKLLSYDLSLPFGVTGSKTKTAKAGV